MRLLIDGNSLLNEALLRGTDREFGRTVKSEDGGKDIFVNSAQYGVDGFFDKMHAALKGFGLAPCRTVVVWDGANAKAHRRTFLPQYKEGRDKDPAVSEQLNIAREAVSRALYFLGVAVAQQPSREADDVLGYLTRHLRDERNVVVTSDGDLSVLHDENTDVWNKGALNENPCGPFPHKYITLYKSLVGDRTDKIPGAPKFGDGAFVDFVRAFGLEGLDEMQRMIVEGQLDELKDSLEDFPRLKLILDNKDLVTTCWRVASLHVDDVNTMRRPLEIVPGMVTGWDDVPDEFRVHEMKGWYGTKTLVTAQNYEKVLERFKRVVVESPFVPLDIETSPSAQSQEYSERIKQLMDSDRLDVLGHELTGMSITFGDNLQHTIYMSVDHAETDNITVDQCRVVCEAIPKRLHTVIQNRSFEFSVLYRTWGAAWKNNGWHGFVPNAIDSMLSSSYVDENLPKGLKEQSKIRLGYEQQTYDQVTTLSGPVGTLPQGGEWKRQYEKELVAAVIRTEKLARHDHETGEETTTDVDLVISPPVTETWEDRQYNMRELTAAHVFNYGCDDTICTGAIHNFNQLVLQMEGTWQTYLQVETLPEYLTSLAFVQGVPISLSKLREMETKDEERYAKAWATLRTYLMQMGWAGTLCPEFEGALEPSDVKVAAETLLDGEFSTRKRKLNAIAVDIREQFPDSQLAEAFAVVVERGDTDALNHLMRENFTGEPKINFGSPKQMQDLFYRVIGIRPRLFNKMTEKQRADDVMSGAFRKMRRAKDADVDVFSLTEAVTAVVDGKSRKLEPLTDEEREALISKATTDDEAVAWALAKDPITAEQREVLQAFATLKTVLTRRSLFYKTYKNIPHWRDGRIHPSLKQSEAVTRRYSASGPNVQQMPKRGEGVEFRQIILPHCKDAVVVSMDFSGQELRSMAEQSGDANLTACFVGDNLKDPHSLTAVAAAASLWGEDVEYDDFMQMLDSPDATLKKKAKDLRGDGKTVNFGTQYDLQAPGLAVKLLCDEETAQEFIDAKGRAFPGIEIWKDDVRKFAEKHGFVTTLMGARRHLREALMSDNKWEAGRAGRQGPNFKIQSSGAEQTKLAEASMWKLNLFTGKYNAQFYFPVHDETVFSVHRDDAYALICEAHACMIQPYGGMKIPLVSSISLGANFGQQIECGDVPNKEVIEAAIREALGA
jgi:5'-3' exonuclease